MERKPEREGVGEGDGARASDSVTETMIERERETDRFRDGTEGCGDLSVARRSKTSRSGSRAHASTRC